MATKVKTLRQYDDIILPKTVTSAVSDGLGNSLDTILSGLSSSINVETTRAQAAEQALNNKLGSYQEKIDNDLQTADKTIVGAINELKNKEYQIHKTISTQEFKNMLKEI